jgi:alpha-ketoglutarate-dependent taurine dioxygenase
MKFLIEQTYDDLSYSPQDCRSLLQQYKVVVLRDFGLEEEPLSFFERFSDELGGVCFVDEDLSTGKATGKRWIDVAFDPAVQDKYRTSSVAHPLHTDGAYMDFESNVQFFYCVEQAWQGGATVFIDTRYLVDLLIVDKREGLLDRLQATDVIHAKGGLSKVVPILRKTENDWRINWNFPPAKSGGNTADAMQLIEDFNDFLEKRVRPSGLLTEVMLRENDVVFFHDELVLHGRNSYFTDGSSGRCLKKGTILL